MKYRDGLHIDKVSRGNGHKYHVADADSGFTYEEKIPSVTSVLRVINKPALIPWAAKKAAEASALHALGLYMEGELDMDMYEEIVETGKQAPNEVRNSAGNVGTAAHSVIEARLKGEDCETTMLSGSMLNKIDQWFDDYLPEYEVIGLEQPVYCPFPLPYVGTADALMKVNDSVVLMDWKTGSALYPETALQLAAYSHAIEYSFNIVIDEAWAVLIPRTGAELEVKMVNLNAATNAFQDALRLEYALSYEGDELWTL